MKTGTVLVVMAMTWCQQIIGGLFTFGEHDCNPRRYSSLGLVDLVRLGNGSPVAVPESRQTNANE